MCRADDCESPSIHRATVCQARKSHRCDECHRSIEPGEQYRYVFMVMEGDALTFHTCAHCMVGQDWLRAQCGNFLLEETALELEEHAVEYPAIAKPLRAFVANMQRQWRRGRGLMRLPAMPPTIDLVEA